MNKTAIKNFAIWARNKLIADISYKAGLLGITEKGMKTPLPQSTQTVQFYDIGTKEPSSITGIEIQQRKKLVDEIERKAKQSDYATAYKNVSLTSSWQIESAQDLDKYISELREHIMKELDHDTIINIEF